MKRDRKSFIINISKEYSIVSQFTSFVAIEEREKVIGQLNFTEIAGLLDLKEPIPFHFLAPI